MQRFCHDVHLYYLLNRFFLALSKHVDYVLYILVFFLTVLKRPACISMVVQAGLHCLVMVWFWSSWMKLIRYNQFFLDWILITYILDINKNRRNWCYTYENSSFDGLLLYELFNFAEMSARLKGCYRLACRQKENVQTLK